MRHPLDYDRSDPEIRRLEREGILALRRRPFSAWLMLLAMLF